MVPLCTESRLRFSVRLDDGARTARFQRVTLNQNPLKALCSKH
jgi:hypothetical protein